VVVAAMAWYVLVGSTGTDGAVLTESTTGALEGQSTAERELLDSLLTLRAIKLDDSVFRDPAFMSLRDFSTQIVSEPVGRPNPFAPLAGMSLSNITSGTSSSTAPASTRTGSFLRSN
jgi:hypothetical protein